MPTVAVLGEALVDLIVAPDGSARAVPGGGPYNAARTLARLGCDAVFLGRLSGDRFGEQLRSELRADGVRLAELAPSTDPTTLAVVELDATGAATYSFYLTATSAADVTPDQARRAMPADAAVVHVGTLGMVLEPVASAVEEVLATLPPTALVFCDPNCRPGAIPDREVYVARLHRVLGRTHVVKVSGDDLSYLDPTRPVEDVAHGLLELGPRVVLFTDGGEAVRVLTSAGRRTVPVPTVEVVDTVGAGDAFGAGFLCSWLAAGHGVAELTDLDRVVAAAGYGARVAAITCTRQGADPPTAAVLAAS